MNDLSIIPLSHSYMYNPNDDLPHGFAVLNLAYTNQRAG